MITVTFDHQLRYRRAPGFVGPSPLFEVILPAGGNTTPRIPALLDTGSKRNLPMTARVQGIIQRRHYESGKPDLGYLFPRDKEGKDHVPYDTINSQHDVTLRLLTTLKRFRLYDLRHTLLTRLGEAGADAFALQKIAGHSTIAVSQRYVHPTPERVEDAFSRLERYNARKAEELKVRGELAELKSTQRVVLVAV